MKVSAGIIGVGAMGGAVARRLLGSGVTTYVRDIRPHAMAELAALGARACASSAQLARACGVIILLVVDAKQIEEVLFGNEGAAEHMQLGSVVLLSSTIAPEDAARFSEQLSARGMHALDAPVSGGPARAGAGEMSMMIAGDPSAVQHAEPVLNIISNKIFRVSDKPGDGARFKLINNMLAATNLAAGAEAMALGMRMGLDSKRLLEVIGASSGASWVMLDRMARALEDDYAPRAATKILAKDISLALDLASKEHFPAMLASQAMQAFQAALAQGLGEEDDASLLKMYQRLPK
ncbi:MAG: NAD(P)-dependent oxidoreductase [Burkholderiales bacterium]